MFFDDLTDIPRLARSAQTTIFAVAPDTEINLPNALNISPLPDKNAISISQIREIVELGKSKQTSEQFIIIRQAELLNTEPSNALLKLLEEPKDNYHYILVTSEPSELLPTILSRANLFVPRVKDTLSKSPNADAKTMSLAKKILTATPAQLPALADEIAKIKDSARAKAISATAVAIELAYKSYFATKKASFLAKIPKLINLHQNLKGNGNLKLHIVADLC